MTPFKEISKNAVFIVGCPRSGTTMTISLLDGHPELLVYPHETFFLQRPWRNKKELIDILTRRFRYSFEKNSETGNNILALYMSYINNGNNLKDYFLALYEVFYRHFDKSDKSNKKMLVEKTPEHIYVLPLLKSFFSGNFKVIYLYRDPRAVYNSLKKIENRKYLLESFCAHYFFIDFLSNIYEFFFSKSVWIKIKYEDMVVQSEKELMKICRHIGIKFNPCLLETSFNNQSYSIEYYYLKHNKGVTDERINNYKKFLSTDDISSIEFLLYKSMKRNSYPITMPKLKKSFNKIIYYSMIVKNCLRFFSNLLPPLSSNLYYRFFLGQLSFIKLKLGKFIFHNN